MRYTMRTARYNRFRSNHARWRRALGRAFGLLDLAFAGVLHDGIEAVQAIQLVAHHAPLDRLRKGLLDALRR